MSFECYFFSETVWSSRRFLSFLNKHLQIHLPKTHCTDQENKLQKAELSITRIFPLGWAVELWKITGTYSVPGPWGHFIHNYNDQTSTLLTECRCFLYCLHIALTCLHWHTVKKTDKGNKLRWSTQFTAALLSSGPMNSAIYFL